jgi:hypothetical protein
MLASAHPPTIAESISEVIAEEVVEEFRPVSKSSV